MVMMRPLGKYAPQCHLCGHPSCYCQGGIDCALCGAFTCRECSLYVDSEYYCVECLRTMWAQGCAECTVEACDHCSLPPQEREVFTDQHLRKAYRRAWQSECQVNEKAQGSSLPRKVPRLSRIYTEVQSRWIAYHRQGGETPLLTFDQLAVRLETLGLAFERNTTLNHEEARATITQDDSYWQCSVCGTVTTNPWNWAFSGACTVCAHCYWIDDRCAVCISREKCASGELAGESAGRTEATLRRLAQRQQVELPPPPSPQSVQGRLL